jgi:nucleotide-binding universal stress UspA family protein
MGLGESEETVARQVRLTQRLLELRKSVLFFRPPADCSFGERERIDVWWRGRDRNGELMLLLAHLVHINPSWEHAEMRVLRYIEHEEGREQAAESTRELLAEARVRAEVMVLVKSGEEQTFAEVFEGSSQDADLVVLGMPPPDTEHAEGQARRILELLKLTDRAVLLARSGEVEDVLGAE